MLSNYCIPRQQFTGETSLIDPKYPDFQWALPSSASKYFDDKDRYIQETLGVVCQKIILLFWKTVRFQMDNTTACLTI